jgi:hypothetical protein
MLKADFCFFTLFPRFLDKEEVQQLLSELAEHPFFAYEAKKLLKRKIRKKKIF